jgi:selenocysteine-specific translation elongation factor
MAASVTVALLGGSAELAASLGKKGTQSDITLYNAVRDGHATTFVLPSQFPEKLPPLLYAIAMADRAILVVTALDRALAETIATLDLIGPAVTVALGESVGEEELRKLVRGTRLESAVAVSLDARQLRGETDDWAAEAREGPVRVRIDHSFPVKGVGTVVLGLVRQGRLTRHDRLRLYPLDREIEIRSIQVHDVDVEKADCGERVGLALKDVANDDVSRGQTLAPPGTLSVGTAIELTELHRNRYFTGRLEKGNSANLLVGLQFVPVKLEAASPSSISLRSDRPIAADAGEIGLVADLSVAKGPRSALSGQVRVS